MKDLEIIDALFKGNHLSDTELKRAKELVHILITLISMDSLEISEKKGEKK